MTIITILNFHLRLPMRWRITTYLDLFFFFFLMNTYLDLYSAMGWERLSNGFNSAWEANLCSSKDFYGHVDIIIVLIGLQKFVVQEISITSISTIIFYDLYINQKICILPSIFVAIFSFLFFFKKIHNRRFLAFTCDMFYKIK